MYDNSGEQLHGIASANAADNNDPHTEMDLNRYSRNFSSGKESFQKQVYAAKTQPFID